MVHGSDLNALFVAAESADYGRRQEKEFTAALRDLDRQTIVTEINDHRAMLMAPNGEIRIEGIPHRYTRQALSSICSQLCPGLFDVVTDLGGISRPDRVYSRGNDNRRAFFSLRSAVDTFNTVLALRFEALTPLRVVRNSRRRIVDGVIRSGYQWVSHIELWEAVQALLTGRGYYFALGRLAGRQMLFRVLNEHPLYKDTQQTLRYGLQMVHAENSGTAVRVGRSYVRFPRAAGCWNPGSGSGVRHTGQALAQRVQTAIQQALIPEDWEATASTRLKALRDVRVDQCKEAALPDRAIRSLGKEIGSQQCAKEVWESARRQRAFGDISLIGTTFHVPPLTGYDVWCALGEFAAKMPILRQDNLERALYGYLVGSTPFQSAV